MSDDVGSPEVAVALALLAVDDPAAADDAQAPDCLTAGTGDLGLVTRQAVQELGEALPNGLLNWSSGTRSAAHPHAINPVTPVAIPAMMANMEEVEVVVAHNERATLRVGDVFLKIDADQTRTDVEVEAMAMAPIPTPEILWRKPPVLTLAALPGTALGHLGEPSAASSAAWAAAGAAVRTLHDAPLPPEPRRARIAPRRRMRVARRQRRPSRRPGHT
jgi:hypothetical protein